MHYFVFYLSHTGKEKYKLGFIPSKHFPVGRQKLGLSVNVHVVCECVHVDMCTCACMNVHMPVEASEVSIEYLS